jgi:hypothetical protein
MTTTNSRLREVECDQPRGFAGELMTNDADIALPVALPVPFRKLLLRALLWSLGIAAACGAIAVLSGGFHVVKRVMMTAMLTAVASILLLGAAYLVDRALTRPAGLLGMAAVVVEYLLILALLWFRLGERLALTIACIAAPVVPAMLFLIMAAVPQARVAGRVGVASSAVIGVLLLGGVWVHDSPWQGEDWYYLAAAIATFFPAAVLCLVGAGTDRRHWRWIGVGAAAAACAAMFHGMANNPQGGDSLFAGIVSLAVVVAHANVLMLLPLKRAQRWLRWGTILAAIATACFIDLVFLTHSAGYHSDWYDWATPFQRWAGACAIVAGCGTLALLVLGRLNRKVEMPVHALETITEVTLICPACRKKQTLPVGDARCASCDVMIFTRFQAPRCPACDYSLFMLTAERCPECGTRVRDLASPAPIDSLGAADRPRHVRSESCDVERR